MNKKSYIFHPNAVSPYVSTADFLIYPRQNFDNEMLLSQISWAVAEINLFRMFTSQDNASEIKFTH
jgi:hypothetical protein